MAKKFFRGKKIPRMIYGTKGFIRSTPQYDRWKWDVCAQNYWCCSECGNQFDKHSTKLAAHHIIKLNDLIAEAVKLYPMESEINAALQHPRMFDVTNGIALCRSCHLKLHRKKQTEKKICYLS